MKNFTIRIRKIKYAVLFTFLIVLYAFQLNLLKKEDIITYLPVFSGYNISFILSLYIFRGFDDFSIVSFRNSIIAFFTSTLTASLLYILLNLWILDDLYASTFIVTVILTSTVLPLSTVLLFRYIIRRLPPRRYLIIGEQKTWEPFIKQIMGTSVRRIEIVDYVSSDDSIVENFSKRNMPLDAVIIADIGSVNFEKLSDKVKHHAVSLISLASFIENSLKRIPEKLFEDNLQYYQISLSNPRYSKRIRILDIFFSIGLLVILSPFLLLSILLILLLDGFPVFYNQDRVGIHEKRFRMYKLRTMNIPAHPEDAPVLTRSGLFLRKLRFNEIPQLFNVLKGEMSLVGPRPDIISTYEYCVKNIPYYRYRTKVLPGITGHAQVFYKYIDKIEYETFSMRLSYDLYYVKNINVYLYMTILLRTVESIIMRRGA